MLVGYFWLLTGLFLHKSFQVRPALWRFLKEIPGNGLLVQDTDIVTVKH